MTDTTEPLPRSRAALQALDRAVQRLETAISKTDNGVPLGDELKAVRADYARLDAASRQVEAGLDGIISRLKTALEA